MLKRAIAILMLVSLSGTAYTQDKAQQKSDDQPIRISTELIQLDAVVTDKNGKVVSGLTKDDFELFESGKRQSISFFEFVEATIGKKGADKKPGIEHAPEAEELTEADVKRIFAFVVDDLTIRGEDLTYVREMLTNYVNNQMGPQDLVAIIRTVGGRGLLQQFTSNKQLLLRAIASLTVSTHPLSAVATAGRDAPLGQVPQPLSDTETVDPNASEFGEGAQVFGPQVSPAAEAIDESRQVTRAIMTLGTASFLIDSMKQLPGRKSLVLVSGGLPILRGEFSTYGVDISNLINRLADSATRAGVAVHTMDIRGLSANAGVASFADTPARSAIPTDLNSLRGSISGPNNRTPGFGRGPNEDLLGRDVVQDQLGLRVLASATGGLSVMNRNNFSDGLGKIVESSEGYYLLAYTPTDEKFDGKYRRIEVKVKRGGLKVLTRSGYFAKVDTASASPLTKEQQLLAAVRSPLARRDVNVSAMMTYRAVQPPKDAAKDKSGNTSPHGAIDIHLLIDPKTLKLEEADGRQKANFDVAVFVFDEFGEMRGGFSKTIDTNLSPEEFKRISSGGLTYSADTMLPPGAYQIRMAVRDNKTGGTGTLQRYIEVPDLSEGKLAASSLLISGAPTGDTKTPKTTVVAGDRRISRNLDLRYAVMVYNAKLKDGKPQVRVEMAISQNGKVLHKEQEEVMQSGGGNAANLIKVGQLGLSRVPPGRYTITLTITDPLADKKSQTLIRSQDFIVE